VQDPLDAPLMGSNMIQGPKTEIRRHSAGTESGCQLPRRFLSTPEEFVPETGAIGSILKLSFERIPSAPKSDFVYDLDVRFSAGCTWSPKQTRT